MNRRQLAWAVLIVPAGFAVGAAWGALTDLADRDPGRVADLLVALIALAALAAGALTVIVTDLHDKVHRERELNRALRGGIRSAVEQTAMAGTLEDVRRLPETGDRP
jgi:MFS family permease